MAPKPVKSYHTPQKMGLFPVKTSKILVRPPRKPIDSCKNIRNLRNIPKKAARATSDKRLQTTTNDCKWILHPTAIQQPFLNKSYDRILLLIKNQGTQSRVSVKSYHNGIVLIINYLGHNSI